MLYDDLDGWNGVGGGRLTREGVCICVCVCVYIYIKL